MQGEAQTQVSEFNECMSSIYEDLASTYSDMHKDAYGFRPRHIPEWTISEFEAEFERLQVALDRAIAEDNAAYEAAAIRMESRIESTIALGAGTRENAIRWMMDADNVNGDIEYFCYLNGLRYGYFNSI